MPSAHVDLEKLARRTAESIQTNLWLEQITMPDYVERMLPLILSALHEAVRERDELAEEFRQQRNMLKQACFNKDAALDMKDTEIARLTDENERMRDALKFIQNNLLAWNEVVRDDTISDSAVRGAACMRIATLHEIARAALDKHGEPPHRADGE